MNNLFDENACTPISLDDDGFNANAIIPYGCTVEHIRAAMQDFLDFIGFINGQLHTREMMRLESTLNPANFSKTIGEFIGVTLPKYCPTIARNHYQNGHPDLVPIGLYHDDAVQYGREGIEIKASRYLRGWPERSPETSWLVVFCFDSNTPADALKGTAPRPFQFLLVAGALLTREDWAFSDSIPTDRRIMTVSVTKSGYAKMMANWIYKIRPFQWANTVYAHRPNPS